MLNEIEPEFLIGKLLYFLLSALFLSETAAQQLRFDSHNYEIGMPKRIFLFQRVKSQLVLELHYCTSLQKETLHFPKETSWKRKSLKYISITVISHGFCMFLTILKWHMQIVYSCANL